MSPRERLEGVVLRCGMKSCGTHSLLRAGVSNSTKLPKALKEFP
jgi:hypothetical protein